MNIQIAVVNSGVTSYRDRGKVLTCSLYIFRFFYLLKTQNREKNTFQMFKGFTSDFLELGPNLEDPGPSGLSPGKSPRGPTLAQDCLSLAPNWLSQRCARASCLPEGHGDTAERGGRQCGQASSQDSLTLVPPSRRSQNI